MLIHAATRLAGVCQVPYDLSALFRISAGWRSIVTNEVDMPRSAAVRVHSGRNQLVRGSLTTTASPFSSSPASHLRSAARAASSSAVANVASHALGRESLTVTLRAFRRRVWKSTTQRG